MIGILIGREDQTTFNDDSVEFLSGVDIHEQRLTFGHGNALAFERRCIVAPSQRTRPRGDISEVVAHGCCEPFALKENSGCHRQVFDKRSV